MVAYACKLSYLGDRDQEVCGSRPAKAKISETIISTNELGRNPSICLSAKLHGSIRRIVFKACQGKNETLYKNN
jgi:hypothetical protein